MLKVFFDDSIFFLACTLHKKKIISKKLLHIDLFIFELIFCTLIFIPVV